MDDFQLPELPEGFFWRLKAIPDPWDLTRKQLEIRQELFWGFSRLSTRDDDVNNSNIERKAKALTTGFLQYRASVVSINKTRKAGPQDIGRKERTWR